MREILFRGKCIKSGNWVEGDLIHGVGSKSGKMYVLPNKINLAYVKHCDLLDGVNIITETVSQFTGIVDKNGIKIFEGDILKLGAEKEKFEVRFKHGCFMAYCNRKQYGLIGELKYCFIEVIGNIFDNPEKLK